MLIKNQYSDYRSQIASPSTRKNVVGKQGDQLKALLASKQKAAMVTAAPTVKDQPLTDPLARKNQSKEGK
jgi:hypothetical protein